MATLHGPLPYKIREGDMGGYPGGIVVQVDVLDTTDRTALVRSRDSGVAVRAGDQAWVPLSAVLAADLKPVTVKG